MCEIKYKWAGFRPAHFFLKLLLLLCLLSACSKTPDDQQIAKNIEAIAAAVEAGKFSEIAKYLHEDFRANGHMDEKQVKQMLMMYGMQSKAVSVTIVSSKNTIDPVYTDSAETTLSVIASTSSVAGIPDDGSVRVVKLRWRKDDDWKISQADWRE